MNPGDRFQLRFRPLTGTGTVIAWDEGYGKWRVRLDDGMTAWADDEDLLPEALPDTGD